jgi:hypothetical protein
VSSKTAGTWSAPVDYSKIEFTTYLRQPWRLESLRYGNYERYLLRQINAHQERKDKSRLHDLRAFRELNQLLMTEWFTGQADSVRLVYCLTTYYPDDRKSRTDTLMVETYNPNAVAPSKAP